MHSKGFTLHIPQGKCSATKPNASGETISERMRDISSDEISVPFPGSGAAFVTDVFADLSAAFFRHDNWQQRGT